jgi:hypothetical protein
MPSIVGFMILYQISRASAQNENISKFDIICTLADKLRSQTSVTYSLAGQINAQL